MDDWRKPVQTTDKNGNQKTVWKGRKPGGRGVGQSRRGLDQDQSARATVKGSSSPWAAFVSRVKTGYGNVQTVREQDREKRRLEAKPKDMSDWDLYKTRDDLIPAKRRMAQQSLKVARKTGDKQAEREATKALTALEKRGAEVDAEIKMRGGPITRLVRRWQDRDWRTGKKLKGRKASGGSRSGSGSTASVEGEHPIIEGTGHVLTSWFDGIWEFIEGVAASSKVKAQSLKFW